MSQDTSSQQADRTREAIKLHEQLPDIRAAFEAGRRLGEERERRLMDAIIGKDMDTPGTWDKVIDHALPVPEDLARPFSFAVAVCPRCRADHGELLFEDYWTHCPETGLQVSFMAALVCDETPLGTWEDMP